MIKVNPTLYTKTMTNLDTEYSQVLPSDTKFFTIRCRTSYDVRIAFVTGKVAASTDPFKTIVSGSEYVSPDDISWHTSKTIYFACGTAAQKVEIEVWQ